MPCGGIDIYKDVPTGECFVCGGEGAIHYCMEWDCMLHASCILKFLATPEGELVIKHQHDVHIYYSLAKVGSLKEELPNEEGK